MDRDGRMGVEMINHSLREQKAKNCEDDSIQS